MFRVEVLASSIACVKNSSCARLFAAVTPVRQGGAHRQYFRRYRHVSDDSKMKWFDRSRLRIMAYRQAFDIIKTRVIQKAMLHFRSWCTLSQSLGHCATVSSLEKTTMSSVFLRKIAGQHEMSSPRRSMLRLWGTHKLWTRNGEGRIVSTSDQTAHATTIMLTKVSARSASSETLSQGDDARAGCVMPCGRACLRL